MAYFWSIGVPRFRTAEADFKGAPSAIPHFSARGQLVGTDRTLGHGGRLWPERGWIRDNCGAFWRCARVHQLAPKRWARRLRLILGGSSSREATNKALTYTVQMFKCESLRNCGIAITFFHEALCGKYLNFGNYNHSFPSSLPSQRVLEIFVQSVWLLAWPWEFATIAFKTLGQFAGWSV